ncbi:MAG: hypothetical protein FWB96_13480 [Defluviitaleaceae bacterium]|nr:hypothetical protein [Defluviitaleaceae bacterium]MCL2264330.1 hypothetical protein [Defluviitaleaceae bacterium]
MSEFLGFFENVFAALGRHDNHVVIVAVYLCITAALLVLRVFAHLHFRGALHSFHGIAAKELKSKNEAAKLKNPVLKSAAAEYIRMAERSVSAVPTVQIVERAVSAMNFFGWKYTGLLPFIETMELGILGIGFVLAVVYLEEAAVYGLLAIIAFISCRVAAAIFNAREVRAQFVSEMVLFIEREIGRFYAADTGGVLLRLKNDLTEAIDRQSETYKQTLEEISVRTADIFRDVLHNMVGAAAEINGGAVRLAQASDKVHSAADLLATQMKAHSNSLSDQLVDLMSAQQTITAQTEFIQRNQKALETSLNAYESSLQNLTQSIGDGLGTFINLHAQTSAQTINDAMRTNIEQIMNMGKRQ